MRLDSLGALSAGVLIVGVPLALLAAALQVAAATLRAQLQGRPDLSVDAAVSADGHRHARRPSRTRGRRRGVWRCPCSASTSCSPRCLRGDAPGASRSRCRRSSRSPPPSCCCAGSPRCCRAIASSMGMTTQTSSACSRSSGPRCGGVAASYEPDAGRPRRSVPGDCARAVAGAAAVSRRVLDAHLRLPNRAQPRADARLAARRAGRSTCPKPSTSAIRRRAPRARRRGDSSASGWTPRSARLPVVHRQVLMLALEDLSHAEIGGVLGIRENAVAVRLTRARQALREALGVATMTSKTPSSNRGGRCGPERGAPRRRPTSAALSRAGRRRLVRRMALEVVMAVAWIAVGVLLIRLRPDPALMVLGAGIIAFVAVACAFSIWNSAGIWQPAGESVRDFVLARRRTLPPRPARGPLRPLVCGHRNGPARRVARLDQRTRRAARDQPAVGRLAGAAGRGAVGIVAWLLLLRRRAQDRTGDARGCAPPVRRVVATAQGSGSSETPGECSRRSCLSLEP